MHWMRSFLTPRRRKQLTRADSLTARPMRNPAVTAEEVDGAGGTEIVLSLPPPRPALAPALRLLLAAPRRSRQIQLDAVGSFVWSQCDGTRSVNEICDLLCAEYRLSYREAMLSLTTYLRQLGRRGLIAFALRRPDSADGQDREVEAEKSENEG